MNIAAFRAVSPFEIGDKVQNSETGKVHTITDIACIHYCKSGKVEFRYQLDGLPEYVPINTKRITSVSFN